MANESSPNQAQGITAITVSGFKSLRDESRIEVRPLTILAGANSSGKSTIMQPLLLMKQTLEAPYDPGPLLLNGPNVKFTSAEQFLSMANGKEHQSFIVKMEIQSILGKQSLSNTFDIQLSDSKRIIDLVEMIYKTEDEETILRINMSHDEITPQLPQYLKDYFDHEQQGVRWRVIRRRCFLGIDPGPFDMRGMPLGKALLVNPSGEFEREIIEIIHVLGLRGNPERVYNFTPAVGPMFQGAFENYVASVIYQWQEDNDSRLDFLERNLLELGLTSKVAAKRINDVQIELRVGRTLTSDEYDLVSIADVGFGVSQVLPVLVALLVAEPGQLVYIEQPELHLHPRAQVALAQVLADAANRGVRVVAETHSDLLLLGLQTLVAEEKLSPDIVKLHWFERDENGVTHITSSDVEEDGAFESWPEDFSEVTLKAQSRYLDAAEAHRIGS